MLKLEEKKPKDLAELIYRVIVAEEATYYENGNVQCSAHSARSLEDTLEVIKNYFPKVTKTKLNKCIKKLINDKFVSCWYCSDIEKTVHAGMMLANEQNVRDSIGELNYGNSKDKIKIPPIKRAKRKSRSDSKVGTKAGARKKRNINK